MILQGLVGIGVFIALLAANTPRLGLGLVFAAYVLLPFTPVGRIYIPGSGVGFHVATILVLMLVVTASIGPAKTKLQDSGGIPAGVHVLVVAFVFGALVNQLVNGSAPATSLAFMLNQIVTPYLFFMLCVNENRRDPSFLPQAVRVFVLAGALQAIIAIGVATKLWPQPFAASFSSSWWWRQEFVEGGRQLGTLDSPLNLGLFLAVCVPLVGLVFRSMIARMLCEILLIAGVLLTQSRIAVGATLIGILYLALFGARHLGPRIMMFVGLLSGYIVLDHFGLFDDLIARVADDKGSSQARSLAWQYLLPHWTDFLITGLGIFESKSYLISRGFFSSAESAVLSYGLSFGLLYALCYFAAMVWIIVVAVRVERRITPTILSAMLALGYIQFYSSIATESSASYLLWTCLFFAFGQTVSTSLSRAGELKPQLGRSASAGTLQVGSS